MSEVQPSKRLWRALVRVDAISDDEKHLFITIPSWDSTKQLCIEAGSIRNVDVLTLMEPGSRFYASVNIGAERSEDLIITNWKIPRDGRAARFV